VLRSLVSSPNFRRLSALTVISEREFLRDVVSAPEEGESWDVISQDFDEIILPGFVPHAVFESVLLGSVAHSLFLS
jgi:hypothetical protein